MPRPRQLMCWAQHSSVCGVQICRSSFDESFVGCPHDRLRDGHRLRDTEREGLVRRGRFRKLVGHIIHAGHVHEPLLPPGIRQLEDRLVGQDRLVDAHRQLRPEGGAVVDGVADSQEGGPAPVDVPELGVEGALPQLPSWAAGAWLVPRYGARVMMVGLLALLVGTVAAAVVYGTGRPKSYPLPLLPAVAVAGLGQGLYAVPFFTTALHHVRPHETGSRARDGVTVGGDDAVAHHVPPGAGGGCEGEGDRLAGDPRLARGRRLAVR